MIGAVICVVFLIGIMAYGARNRRPEPLTMDQCRDLARKSADVQKHIEAHAAHMSAHDVIEAAATQCVVDHAADTYNLSLERRVQATAQLFCVAKAADDSPGDSESAKRYRENFTRTCLAVYVQSALRQ